MKELTGRLNSRYPEGVDRVFSVRPRWTIREGKQKVEYAVVRIWYDGRVDSLETWPTREVGAEKAREQAQTESTVYMIGPEASSRVGEDPGLFGEIPGVQPGSRFRRREDLRKVGLHRGLQQGIDWTADGALAVVFSGVYADDVWSGDEAWYTGEGGQDQSGHQVKDQQLERGNRALVSSYHEGLPVRVIRRRKVNGDHEFVYEGLFYVLDYTYGPGKDGPKVYRFLLHKAVT